MTVRKRSSSRCTSARSWWACLPRRRTSASSRSRESAQLAVTARAAGRGRCRPGVPSGEGVRRTRLRGATGRGSAQRRRLSVRGVDDAGSPAWKGPALRFDVCHVRHRDVARSVRWGTTRGSFKAHSVARANIASIISRYFAAAVGSLQSAPSLAASFWALTISAFATSGRFSGLAASVPSKCFAIVTN